MATEINKLSGVVSVTLDGVGYKLKATMPNMAALQAAIDVPGLRMLNALISTGDARLAYHGMRCLCVSGNAQELDNLLFPAWVADAIEAVSDALQVGLPDPVEDGNEGKESAAPMTESLGDG